MVNFGDKLIATVQDVAITYKTWRGDASALVGLVDPSLRAEVPMTDLEKALGREDIQRALFDRDVALWRGANKQFRLIDQQPPTTTAQAHKFVTTRTDGHVCRFCRMADDPIELHSDGSGSFVHLLCRRAWYRWCRAALVGMRNRSSEPWWKVLGVDPKAVGADDIKRAYKSLAQKHHPDRKGGSAEKMQQLNQARDEALASPQVGNTAKGSQ